MTASVSKIGALDMQVCVPADWSDNKVIAFAEQANPCGTEHGWHVRRVGDALLRGCNERVTCSKDSTMVHIMLDA